MNKDELIEILKERSTHKGEYSEVEHESSEYLNNFRYRRKDDKTVFKLTFALIVLSLAFAYGIYFHFTNKTSIPKSYVKKDQINFSYLSQYEKDKYIPKEQLKVFQAKIRTEDKAQLLTYQKEIDALKNNLEILKKSKVKTVFIEQPKSKRYNAIGCYDETAGTKTINTACKQKIAKFLRKNKKQAQRFEIIAVLDINDKNFIDNKINQVKSEKTIKNNLKNFLKHGLARTRVLEAAWLVKDTLGDKVLITYVNYIAQTKDKRGITIRAYY